jgi:hypothetical protein
MSGEIKDLVLRPEHKELAACLPRNFLTQLGRRFPDVEKQQLTEIFQDALVECRARTTSLQVFDFCIIMSEDDVDIAREIKQALEQTIKLRGCTYDDVITAGMDIINCYELMMEQSCKILFLITRNFTSDNFCRRIQNGAIFQSLMAKVKHAQERCVPVVLNRESINMPLGMSGIAGIVYDDATRSTGIFKKYFSLIQQDRAKIQMKCFEKICIEEVHRKVDEFQREIIETQLAIQDREKKKLAIQNSARLTESSNAITTIKRKNSGHNDDDDENSGHDDDSLLSSIQQALSATMPFMTSQMNNSSVELTQQNELFGNSSNVSVAGSQNHIGTRIENHIIINIMETPKETGDQYPDVTDSSSEED